jgi:TRAP-type mannitol/chloroaromatic compound transport system permease small subunit
MSAKDACASKIIYKQMDKEKTRNKHFKRDILAQKLEERKKNWQNWLHKIIYLKLMK